MDDCPARLHELNDPEFESFVRRFTDTVWNGWESTISPPSPDHSVDVRLVRGDVRELLHVIHRPAESSVGAPAVRDLVAICNRHAFDGVTLASLGAITDSARTVAADNGVSVLDGDAICRLCDELNVEIPEPSDEESELRGVLETYAAYWPASLAERTDELLDAVGEFAAFEYHVSVGDASTVVNFLVNDRPVVKARLGETNFLIYVRTDEKFESVVRLSAYRETQPPLAELLADLEPHIKRAIEWIS